MYLQSKNVFKIDHLSMESKIDSNIFFNLLTSFFFLNFRHIMNKLFIVFLGLFAVANAFSILELVKEEWHAFKVNLLLYYKIIILLKYHRKRGKKVNELNNHFYYLFINLHANAI